MAQIIIEQNGYEVPDSHLFSSSPDNNYGSDTVMYVGILIGKTTRINRSILSFPLDAIPNGSTINNAKLVLYASVGATSNFPSIVYRITQSDWIENFVTWNKYNVDSNWTTPGGDYTTSEGISWNLPISAGSFEITGLDNLVIDAINNRNNELHILLRRSSEFIDSSRVTLRTGESSFGRPQLVIDYTPLKTINFGPKAEFVSSGSVNYISVDTFDENTFVVAYQDEADANHGTAKIGTVNGKFITFHSETEFLSTSGNALDNDISVLNTSGFVIAYTDESDSNHGTVKIGTINDTDITFGDESEFLNVDGVSRIAVSTLSSSGFVVAYRDQSDSNHGVAKIGTINGTSVSFGSGTKFLSGSTPLGIADEVRVVALDEFTFIVSYRDVFASDYGMLKVGTVSGTDIFFGDEISFGSPKGGQPGIKAIDSSTFIISYKDTSANQSGITQIGTVNGTSITLGERYSYSDAALINDVAVLTASEFVTSYLDVNNSAFGVAQLGVIDESSGILFSAPVEFLSSGVATYSHIATLNANKFVVVYRDTTNSDHGTAKIGNVISDSIEISGDMFVHGHFSHITSGDLYTLGRETIAISGDFYIEGHGASVSSGNLFIHGHTDILESGNLFIQGNEIFQSSGDLFIQSHDVIQISGHLFVHGKDSASTSGDLFIEGKLDQSTSGNLYIDGHEISIISGDLFVYGQDAAEVSGDLFIQGYNTSQASGNLYITAYTIIESSGYLFISAQDKTEVSGSLFIAGYNDVIVSGDLFIYGHNDTLTSGNLFTKGYDIFQASGDLFIKVPEQIIASGTLFLKAEVADISTSGDLFISGPSLMITSGNLFIQSYDILLTSGDLFVHGQDSIKTSGNLFVDGFIEASGVSSPSLFIHGHDIVFISGSLYVRGYESLTTSGNLFIYGQDKIVLSSDLFVEGSDVVQISGSLHINGNEISTTSSDLFINGSTIASESENLFIDGHIDHTFSGDLFIQGQAVSIISGISDLFINAKSFIFVSGNLFIHGQDTLRLSGDLYIQGPSFNSISGTLFIDGSGIIPINDIITLFINGILDKEPVSCPVLDPGASIQISEKLIDIYQSHIDALINQLGKNVVLNLPPQRILCPNCQQEIWRKRSVGVYKIGGPRPFVRGRKCPYCKGEGFLQTPVQKCIKCLIKWNPKDFENYDISVQKQDAIVRLKTYLFNMDDLLRSETAIVEYDQVGIVKFQVRRIRNAVPTGLRRDRYCISFWELI